MSGMLKSSIPGRTDKIPLKVAGGSYIIPADIPSALGQGNTMAGGAIMDKMFSSGPYGLSLRGGGRGKKFANGGQAPADIIAAGGEYVLSPEQVARVGHGDIDAGHKILDAFVKKVRDRHIQTLKKLPDPKKD